MSGLVSTTAFRVLLNIRYCGRTAIDCRPQLSDRLCPRTMRSDIYWTPHTRTMRGIPHTATRAPYDLCCQCIKHFFFQSQLASLSLRQLKLDVLCANRFVDIGVVCSVFLGVNSGPALQDEVFGAQYTCVHVHRPSVL